MGAKKRKDRERIDPAPRLGMVLIRYSLGLFEQQELAAALGVSPSQVSMWESGPADSQAGALAAAVAVDLLPLLVEAVDIVLSPLIQTASDRSTAGDPAEAEELWTRLERRTARERLLIVEEGEEYQTLALHERVLAESAALAATEPRQARELAQLAARIAELAVLRC